MNQAGTILALMVSSGLVTAAIQAWLVRRRTSAETTDVITQAAERLVSRVEADNLSLRREVIELRREVLELRVAIDEERRESHRLRLQLGDTSS